MKETINRLISDDKGNIAMTTAERLMKQGFEQGKLEGKLEGKLDTAKNLLKEKMPVNKISEITGLSVDEIQKLKNKNCV